VRRWLHPGLPAVLGLVSNLLLSGALVVALDPRLGGRATLWLLSATPGGAAAPATGGPVWAALILCLLVGLAASTPLASRALFLDRALPALLSSPMSSRRLLWTRVRGTLLGLGRLAGPFGVALAWLCVSREGGAGPGAGGAAVAAALTVALAGAVSALSAATLAGVLVSLTLAAVERRHPALGRLLSLPLALLPLTVATALMLRGWAGPAFLTPAAGLVTAGATGLGLLAAILWLGPVYRRLASRVPLRDRWAGRRVWTPLWLKGPVGAVVTRDVGLALTNGLTWARVAICLGLGLLYPLVREAVGASPTLAGVLLPGVFGLPLAYTAFAWLLSLGEMLVGLGQVGQAMSLTWLAGPAGASRLRQGRIASGLLLGAPTALLTGGLVLLGETGAAGPVGLFAAILLALAFGQAGLASSGSPLSDPDRRGSKSALEDGVRGAEAVDAGAPGQSLGAIGLLLEQVVVSTSSLKSLGRMAGHLVATLTLPRLVLGWLGRENGPGGAAAMTAATAVLFVIAALPGLIYLLRRCRFWNSRTPAAK
jgi:hypothetical protein